MSHTLHHPSSMETYLARVGKLILHVPTTDASMAAQALVKKGIADLKQGHRDPGTLTEIAMTLGRVEAISEQRLPQSHPMFDALRHAKLTMWEMIRTAAV